jgi:CrcB protein
MSTSPNFASSSALVIFGGGFGAWLRYLTGRAWLAAVGPIVATAFPWATLTANVAGSLAMGLLAGWLARHGAPSFGLSGEHWRLLLGVGVLGGYTTFSAFALEFALFVERGNLGMAALYVGTSLLAGFLALFAGLYVMRVAA